MVLRANAGELMRLGKELRRVDRLAYLETRREIRRIGQEVAEAAAQNAAEQGLERLPGTQKVSVTGPLTFRVRLGNNVSKKDDPESSADYARPMEHSGRKGTFRHPVFGKKTGAWAVQPARPFLGPAATAKLPEFAARVTAALLNAIEAAGQRAKTGGE